MMSYDTPCNTDLYNSESSKGQIINTNLPLAAKVYLILLLFVYLRTILLQAVA